MQSWVAESMRSVLIAMVCVSLMLIPSVSADLITRIELRDAGVLADQDLGIKAGAVSPDGMDVLIAGADGYARLLSADEADNRAMDVELLTGRSSTIHHVDWHPRGNTALLVGDDGLAMRYDSYDHGITNVNGSFAVFGKGLTAVSWRPAGDFAYVGADDGSLWKFAEHTGFEALENNGLSEITDIDCHRNYNVCFITTMDEGIAVIDKGHDVTWIAQTSAQTWVGVDCADPTLNECAAFASGLRIQAIRINTIDASQSEVTRDPLLPKLPSGEQIGVDGGHDGTTLVKMAPLSILRHNPMGNDVYTVLMAEDAALWDEIIAGRPLAMVWETSTNNGYMITAFGNVVAFSPVVEGVDGGIMTVLVLGAVAISVPGVVLGLIYMNSPWLQKKYNQWRFKSK